MRGGGMGARDRVICREGSFGWNGAGLCAGEPVGTAAARADGFAIASQPRAGRGAKDIQTIDAAASKIREQTQWISRWDYKLLMRPHWKMGVVVGAEYWRMRGRGGRGRGGGRMRGGVGRETRVEWRADQERRGERGRGLADEGAGEWGQQRF